MRFPISHPSLVPLLAIGLLAGAFAGLFGVGGGTVMVPLLLLLPGFDERRATATSLLAIVAMAAAGAALQQAHGQLDPGAALLIGAPAVAGALLGTSLQQRIPARAVSLAFAILLLCVAATMLAGIEPSGDGGGQTRTAAALAGVALLGGAAGVLSGLVGVGGGSIFVPTLVLLLGLGHVQAEATSLLAIVPVSLAGALNQRRYGNLDVRAGLLLGIGSLPGAAVGVALVNALPVRIVELLFALLLCFTAIQLIRRFRRSRIAAGPGRATRPASA